jgi:hypothetical protein
LAVPVTPAAPPAEFADKGFHAQGFAVDLAQQTPDLQAEVRQTVNADADGAESTAGSPLELAGQEADVTARVSVENQVVTLSKVHFTQSAWNQQTMECVTSAFEGQQRSPTADGVTTKFPEGSEYELDAHLAFASPTLQYNQ